MKKLIFLLTFFIGIISMSFGQSGFPNSHLNSNPSTIEVFRGAVNPSLGFILPFLDTANNIASSYNGAMVQSPIDSKTYVSDGIKWTALASGTQIVFTYLTGKYLTDFNTFGTLITDSIAEGTKLFYTTARVRGAISSLSPVNYNSTTGVFSADTGILATQFDLSSVKTNFTNLTGKYITDFNTIGTLITDSIAEGTKQFFTIARARTSISSLSPINYNSSTGVLSADTSILATRYDLDSTGGTKWNVLGNSGITSANRIGTINNSSLRFITNNVVSMIVDSTGNILYIGGTGGASIQPINNTSSTSIHSSQTPNAGAYIQLNSATPSAFTDSGSALITTGNYTGVSPIGSLFRVRSAASGVITDHLIINNSGQTHIGNSVNMTINPYAMLDITSTNSGLLIPRMNTAQAWAIGGGKALSNIPISLLIYNTDSAGVCIKISGVDSIWAKFGLALPGGGGGGSGTVTNVGTGYGLIGGPITNTGTILADTSRLGLSTNLWRQKGVDSLSALIVLKVNISDTAAMLSKYLLKSDTLSMLSKYLRKSDTATLSARIDLKVNISDTSTMLSKYLRKSDTTSMLVPYLHKTDTFAMLSPYLRKVDTANIRFRPIAGTGITLAGSYPSITISSTGGGGIDSIRRKSTTDTIRQWTSGTPTFAFRDNGLVDSIINISTTVQRVYYSDGTTFDNTFALDSLFLTGDVTGGGLLSIPTVLGDITHDWQITGILTTVGSAARFQNGFQTGTGGSSSANAYTTSGNGLMNISNSTVNLMATGFPVAGMSSRFNFAGNSAQATANFGIAGINIGINPFQTATTGKHPFATSAFIGHTGSITNSGARVGIGANLILDLPSGSSSIDSSYSQYSYGKIFINDTIFTTATMGASYSGIGVMNGAAVQAAIGAATGGSTPQLNIYDNLGGSIVAEGITMGIDRITNNYTLSSTTCRMTLMNVTSARTITGVTFLLTTAGAYTSTAYNGFLLYSYNSSTGVCTLVARSTDNATLWSNGAATGWVKQAFSSPYSATTGTYVLLACYNNSASTTNPIIGAGTTFVSTDVVLSDFPNSGKIAGSLAAKTSAPAIGSTFNIATVTANTANPYFAGYQ